MKKLIFIFLLSSSLAAQPWGNGQGGNNANPNNNGNGTDGNEGNGNGNTPAAPFDTTILFLGALALGFALTKLKK